MQYNNIDFSERSKNKYSLMFLFFLMLSIIFLIIIIIVAAGVLIFKYDLKWAFLPFESWIYLFTILMLFFIILELTLYFFYKSEKNHRFIRTLPQQDYIDDKRLFIYTYPKDVKGGIFSTTYIVIDNNSVLNLRCLMVPPRNLWF